MNFEFFSVFFESKARQKKSNFIFLGLWVVVNHAANPIVCIFLFGTLVPGIKDRSDEGEREKLGSFNF